MRVRGRSTRNGLSASTAPRVQIAISPLWCSNFSNGFAPRLPVNAGITSSQTPTPMSKSRAKSLFARILIKKFISNSTLKILSQIHAGVQMRDLFFVAVEHQCRLLARKEARPDDSLASLAPAGMIDVRVHIGVEAVFVRRELIPKRPWLFGHEVDLHQGFCALESVLPRNDEADWCAVLIT